jgi:hypothetical protein
LEDRTLLSFSQPILSDAGVRPNAIAVGDLNGTGKLDVVTANTIDNSISVLYGHGDGTFAAPIRYAVGTEPQRVALGSLRGNGLLDIVVANRGVQYSAGSVSIFLNNGDGTFSNAGTLTTDWNPSSIALAHLTNDGNLDVIVTTTDFYQMHHMDIFLGNGDGTFQDRKTITDSTWGFVGGPVDLVVNDFNGDGIPDIVTANSGYSATYFQGNGDGTFHSGLSIPTSHRNAGIVAADLRGNGILDLISAGDTYGWVTTMRGNGNGTFQAPQGVGFDGSSSAATADFRNTGVPDIAVVDSSGNTMTILQNAGNGTFPTTKTYPIANGPGSGARFLAVGDFNGDGSPDVVVALTQFNEIGVLLHGPDATQMNVSAADTIAAGNVLAVTVTAESADGTTNPYYTGRVHFTSTDSTAGLPSDYTFTAADAGTHTFDVTLRRAGSQQVTVTDTSTSALHASTTALVTAGEVSSLVVSGFPSPARAGSMNTFTVRASDAYGNVATGYTGTIHFTSTDAKAVLPDDYTFKVEDNGSQVFAAVLKTAGTQRLIATDTTAADLTGFQTVTVTSAPVDHLLVNGFPSPTVAGSVHTFTVSARDVYDNIATDYRGTVHFTSSDPQAILPDNYAFAAGDNGSRTFGAMLETAGMQSLTASQVSGGFTATQDGIVVMPAAARYFVLFVAPTAIAADEEFDVILRVYDSYGNIATGYTGTVTFATSGAGGTVPANYTFTASDAGEHFFHFMLHQPGQQTITAMDPLATDLEASVSVLVT